MVNLLAWSSLYFILTSCSCTARDIWITRRDDDLTHPAEGTLRWAVQQRGVSRIQFAVAGDIKMKGRLPLTNRDLTIDGSTAPGQGVCIRGANLEFRGAQSCTLRHLRLRLGDENVRASNKANKLARPKNSAGLDCVSIYDSKNILLEHCSLSWSCDEIIAVVHSRGVTLRQCILSEPLGKPELHPYGDIHAFCLNASASTLLVEDCVFSCYHMRGPQFEANDMRREDKYKVKLTAKNCIMHDYTRSGSRYTLGVEDHRAEAVGKRFEFRFQNNLYLNENARSPMIEAETRHGKSKGIFMYQSGNLFSTHWHTALPASYQQLLATVGCYLQRDAVDTRILSNIRQNKYRSPISSQQDVGGWPRLTRG
jgi:hypothetical protein